MRGLATFAAVMFVGALIALLTGAAFPSFAGGIGYMLAASILLNMIAGRRA